MNADVICGGPNMELMKQIDGSNSSDNRTNDCTTALTTYIIQTEARLSTVSLRKASHRNCSPQTSRCIPFFSPYTFLLFFYQMFVAIVLCKHDLCMIPQSILLFPNIVLLFLQFLA